MLGHAGPASQTLVEQLIALYDGHIFHEAQCEFLHGLSKLLNSSSTRFIVG